MEYHTTTVMSLVGKITTISPAGGGCVCALIETSLHNTIFF